MRVELWNLTKEEEKCLISELVDIMKNLIYAEGEEKAKDLLKQIKEAGYLDLFDVIELEYKIKLSASILINIIARLRRTDDE